MAGPITGLYGYRIPLSFLLHGNGELVRGCTLVPGRQGHGRASRPRTAAGTCSPRCCAATLLHVELQEVTASRPACRWAGLALGIPGPDGIDDADGGAPIDRITRSMAGTRWSVIVLAHPVSEKAIGDVIAAAQRDAGGRSGGGGRARTQPAHGSVPRAAAGQARVRRRGDGDRRLAHGGVPARRRGQLPKPGERPGGACCPGGGRCPSPSACSTTPRPSTSRATGRCRTSGASPALAITADRSSARRCSPRTQLAAWSTCPELEAPGFHVDLMPRFDVVVGGRRRGRRWRPDRPRRATTAYRRPHVRRVPALADPPCLRRRHDRLGQDEHDLVAAARRRPRVASRSWSSSRRRPSTARCSSTRNWAAACGCSRRARARCSAPLNPFEVPPGAGERAPGLAPRRLRGQLCDVGAAAAHARALPARGLRGRRLGSAHEP